MPLGLLLVALSDLFVCVCLSFSFISRLLLFDLKCHYVMIIIIIRLACLEELWINS